MRVFIRRAPDGKITLQETAKLAIVTINRPAAKNALTTTMWKELTAIARELKRNPKNRVAILRGTGGAFSAGSDIKEFSQMSVAEANAAFELMEEAIAAIESIPFPVIAAVDGPALGAGFVLSLACDMRIGTPNAKMGIPVSRLGITLGPSFINRILPYIGPGRLKELVFSNLIYDCQRAMELGLLNKVMQSEEIDDIVLSEAHEISRQSRASLRAVKQVVSLSRPAVTSVWNYVDPVDFPVGCRAFIEKRQPNFQ